MTHPGLYRWRPVVATCNKPVWTRYRNPQAIPARADRETRVGIDGLMASRLRTRQVRVWVGWLLLPGLALRLLMPPGFMPGGSADGGHLIKMCHGTGPVPMAVHTPADRSPPPSSGQHHEAPCIFAAAGSAAPPTVAALAIAPPSAADFSPPGPERSAERRPIHRAHPARGPPPILLPA